MNKTNNNNMTSSPFRGVEGGSINNSLSKGGGRGEAYCPPIIEVVRDIYGGGLMDDFLSTNIGSGGGGETPPPSGAKGNGDWGDVWDEPEEGSNSSI